MPTPRRNRKGAPPPYTVGAPSEPGTLPSRSSRPPSNGARVPISDPHRIPWSSRTVPNQHSSGISSNRAHVLASDPPQNPGFSYVHTLRSLEASRADASCANDHPPSSSRPLPGSYPSQDPESGMRPSLASEHSGLLGTRTRTVTTPGYQTMPQHPPPAKRAMSRQSCTTLILIVFAVYSALLYIVSHSTRDELDPVVRERVRREWNKELQSHQVFVKHVEAVRGEWVLETREHERQRAAMVAERRSWQAERAEQERNLSELHQTIERDRRNWETEKWEREREWQQRREEYEKEMEKKRLKEVEERRRQEEEERKRADMRWQELIPSQRCLGFGTREYTARLVGVPWGQDRLTVCRETKAEIHGVPMKPKHCQDTLWEGVWATWVVDFQEPTCVTSWGGLTDKGCTAPGSGTRRYEQRLNDVPSGSEWEVMCATTPADFYGRHFDTPTACVNWGRHGMFGYWDISDPTC